MGKILLVVALFAVLVYAFFWLLERRARRKSSRTHGPRLARPKRAMGPDDDESFLRELEQRRRRAAREEQAKKRPENGEDPEKDQSRPE